MFEYHNSTEFEYHISRLSEINAKHVFCGKTINQYEENIVTKYDIQLWLHGFDSRIRCGTNVYIIIYLVL